MRTLPVMTEEQKRLVEDNYGLLIWFANKHLFNKEDIDLLFIAFCESAILYDKSKSTFSYFSYKHMRNALTAYKKKQVELIPVDQNNILEYFDEEGKYSNIENETMFELFFRDFVNSIRDERKKLIFLLILNGYTYEWIGNYLGMTKQNVHMLIKPLFVKAKEYFKKWK